MRCLHQNLLVRMLRGMHWSPVLTAFARSRRIIDRTRVWKLTDRQERIDGMGNVLVYAESRFCANEGVGTPRSVSIHFGNSRWPCVRMRDGDVSTRDIATKVLLLLWQDLATSSHDF